MGGTGERIKVFDEETMLANKDALVPEETKNVINKPEKEKAKLTADGEPKLLEKEEKITERNKGELNNQKQSRTGTSLRPRLNEYNVVARPRKRRMFRIAKDEDPPIRCRGPYWLKDMSYHELDYSLACCRRGTAIIQQQREKQLEKEEMCRKQKSLLRLMISEENRIEEEMQMESVLFTPRIDNKDERDANCDSSLLLKRESNAEEPSKQNKPTRPKYRDFSNINGPRKTKKKVLPVVNLDYILKNF